jgi:hypothetical protein
VTSDPELIRETAQRLAETANPEKVTEELCVEHHLHWEDAQQLVDEAQETHSSEIIRRQSPLLTLVALTSFSTGIALMSWHLLGLLSFSAALFDPRAPDLLRIFQVYSGFQTLTSLPQALALFVTGSTMTVGSTLGMKDVWHGIFDAWERRNAPEAQLAPPASPLETPEIATVALSWLLLPLAALVAGVILVSQFLVMASVYQASLPPAIDDVFWGAVQRSWQMSGYIQRFPGPFALFLAGLFLLAGGYYVLRARWQALFLRSPDDPSTKAR